MIAQLLFHQVEIFDEQKGRFELNKTNLNKIDQYFFINEKMVTIIQITISIATRKTERSNGNVK